MKNVIIGTAGHVDHGKTSLIQALTGTNPDRLKEELERGMTIDIGFASLRLPDGNLVGIVDVPGHERFLKNMLAGAGGVDVVLLVIAADEGVMPQTEEHLSILRLLDVSNGVVALTKCDLVEKEWIDIVEEDVRTRLKDTFLSTSPIIRVSSTTGRGLEALKKALLSSVSRTTARNASLPMRLPIDRVFTRQGYGTVVTGTLVAGTLQIGDLVEILPQRLASRVRGLQVFGQKQTRVEAGSRVAVNLAGVEIAEIERGAQLTVPKLSLVTACFDASLRLLPGEFKPLKDRARVRIHIGTAEVIGRLRILDARSELPAGATAYVQFLAEQEVVAIRRDRFVVRAYSPQHTIGGGIILESRAQRHRMNDPIVIAALEAKERGNPIELIRTELDSSPFGLSRSSLFQSTGLSLAAGEQAMKELFDQGDAVLLPGDRIIARIHYQTAYGRMESALENFHQKYPLRNGIQKEELRVSVGKEGDPRGFAAILSHAENEGKLNTEGATTRLATFRVTLNERQKALLSRIEEFYTQCGIASPSIEEVSANIHAPPDAITSLIKIGTEAGQFCRVSDAVFYSTRTVSSVKQLILNYITENGTISVGDLRDMMQSNRKYSLQMLEYLDSVRFTARRGDARVLVSTGLNGTASRTDSTALGSGEDVSD